VDLSAGNIVGEIALLNEEERTATVQATSDTTMIVLTLDDLIDMINSDENKINKEIMRRIEENLGE
jgi:CRP-like cAMP-binding protein